MNPLLRRGWFDRLVMAALTLLALAWMAPLLWVLALSFKPNEFLLRHTDVFLAPPYTLQNYLGTVSRPGLADFLSGAAKPWEVMQKADEETLAAHPGLGSLTFIAGGGMADDGAALDELLAGIGGVGLS